MSTIREALAELVAAQGEHQRAARALRDVPVPPWSMTVTLGGDGSIVGPDGRYDRFNASILRLSAAWAAARAALAEQPAPAGAPHVHFGADNELWLLVRDSDGTLRPLADTGPVPMPYGWRSAIRKHREQRQEVNADKVLAAGQADAGSASPPPAGAQAQQAVAPPEMMAALADMLAGWRYIRSFHGDLYGVAWDRAQEKAEKALGLKPGEPIRDAQWLAQAAPKGDGA